MTIPIFFEKIAKFDRSEEPCTCAIPFRQGQLADGAPVAVCDKEKCLPTQALATALWPDTSVKWLLVHFLADLPANNSKSLVFQSNTPAPPPGPPVSIDLSGTATTITTGPLVVELNGSGKTGLFKEISFGALTVPSDSIEGPSITDSKGNTRLPEIGGEGWKIIENGPVRAVVEACGRHCNFRNSSLLDFVARIYAWAGKPWIRLDYQIVHLEKSRQITLNSMDFALKPDTKTLQNIRTATGLSNLHSYKTTIVSHDNGTPVDALIDQDKIINVNIEHAPETFIGTFWADWDDPERGGVCLSHFQAHQNFPKSFAVDSKGITAGYLPENIVDFTLDRGMAKTHRMMMLFHAPRESLENINYRTLQFQMPDKPHIPSGAYHESVVPDPIRVDHPVQEIEQFFIESADLHTRAYGILHWGDCPAAHYTNQGRGAGKLIWGNNEYDIPHAFMLLYIRTGERRFLDTMLVAAEHWMDVDICRCSDDPLRQDGQIIHSVRHCEGPVEPSHEWVEGLLDYYHVTGERRALDTAIGIGRNLLRHMTMRKELREPGAASARDTGWALRSFAALYLETYTTAWLDQCRCIADQFLKWHEKYGAFLAPYTDHALVRIPFMIAIAVASLMRYYRISGDKRIAGLIISAVEDMIDTCRMPEGLFIYKELPSLRRRMNIAHMLEALAAAWELTGDSKFVKAGMRLFNTKRTGDFFRYCEFGPKYPYDDAIIHPGGNAPIGFAASFVPVMSFYRAAVASGCM
ncbi:MAG: hypothetical protein GF350_07415 [Chitinivibrionales bacterium]|nr:hypothetical protein [Chitinivibrionales bacterium]